MRVFARNAFISTKKEAIYAAAFALLCWLWIEALTGIASDAFIWIRAFQTTRDSGANLHYSR
jgi:hypothetical protein